MAAAAPGGGPATLRLKRGEDGRIRDGHLWVFSNEVDVAKTPLSGFTPGQHVLVVDDRERPLGVGYVNPNALIAARILARDPGRAIDRRLVAERLSAALALRARLHDSPHHRLVFGESDGLPGLVLDRFDDVLVGQIATAGMEALRPEIEAAVAEVLAPRALVWKNSGSVRQFEALPEYVEAGIGELPRTVRVHEGGVEFAVDPVRGQKTGWFYDQRANRDLLERFVSGARVLDCFSYVGAWGIRAAALGASEVTCLDASAQAVAQIESNAALNGLSGRVSAQMGDAFEALREMRQQRRRFDVVIVDPPAFAKRRKDFQEARMAYRRINELAMRVLAEDGILVSCSCSFHMPRESFVDAVGHGALKLARDFRVLAHLGQSPDHPVLPAIPETAYLKGVVAYLPPAA
jgi:23S rRNA (cytosine1962-C5)-methyltransferase